MTTLINIACLVGILGSIFFTGALIHVFKLSRPLVKVNRYKVKAK